MQFVGLVWFFVHFRSFRLVPSRSRSRRNEWGTVGRALSFYRVGQRYSNRIVRELWCSPAIKYTSCVTSMSFLNCHGYLFVARLFSNNVENLYKGNGHLRYTNKPNNAGVNQPRALSTNKYRTIRSISDSWSMISKWASVCVQSVTWSPVSVDNTSMSIVFHDGYIRHSNLNWINSNRRPRCFALSKSNNDSPWSIRPGNQVSRILRPRTRHLQMRRAHRDYVMGKHC